MLQFDIVLCIFSKKYIRLSYGVRWKKRNRVVLYLPLFISEKRDYSQPKLRCDGYTFNPDDPYHYGVHEKYLSPDALLTIPSNITVNVTTIPDQKLLFPLQNYGGYLVTDTFYNRGTVNTEHSVTDEFQAAYGYAFNADSTGESGAWYDDLLALYSNHYILSSIIVTKQSAVELYHCNHLLHPSVPSKVLHNFFSYGYHASYALSSNFWHIFYLLSLF